MTIGVFLLSLILLAAGLGSAYMSLDLLPTSDGVLYALGGAVGVAMAIVTFSLGVLIRRINTLTRLVQQPIPVATPPAAGPAEVARTEEVVAPPPIELESSTEAYEVESAPEPLAEGAEAPINENRAGHLPSFADIEHAIETPEAAPSLVGRYTSGGANYMIFNDGSIEAETTEGKFKFASMADFKQFLAERRGEKA
jgi:hypothetical protein